MAVGSFTKMASSQNSVANSGKDLVEVNGVLAFTSTDATIEVSVAPLAYIMDAQFQRVGNADLTDMGVLTIDETLTGGFITVDADQEITIDRIPITSGGTLTTEKFFCRFVGTAL